MNRLIFSLALINVSLFVNAQSRILPDNLLLTVGNHQLKNKSTKVGSVSTQYISAGAEWKFSLSEKVGVNSSILSGIYFPSFTFSEGVRPFILVPITFYRQVGSKSQFNLGFFYRRAFYRKFRATSFYEETRADFNYWELPVTKRAFVGATGSVRYSISERISASVDIFYIPTVNVKEVSNNPISQNEKYYNLNTQVSLYFNPFPSNR